MIDKALASMPASQMPMKPIERRHVLSICSSFDLRRSMTTHRRVLVVCRCRD
jgi:hypothetical protein